MKFTLALKKLPFEPIREQIIYVAGEKDEKVTNLIKDNFLRIRDHFASKGYVFCYIPYVKEELLSRERLHYIIPFAKTAKEAEYMVNDNFILDFMAHPENRVKVTPSLLYYHPSLCKSDDGVDTFKGITISESSFAGDCELKAILNEIIKDTSIDIRYRVHDEEEQVTSIAQESPDSTYDVILDVESEVLIQEIKQRIEKLRTKGIETYMAESMQLKFRKTALSQMHITKDFHIYLDDYLGMEIEMGPLPKAVYLLFLNHPEGIIFKHLPDYQQELRDIYRQLKPTFGTASTLRSIEDVTDPTSNSINVICSRIRTAFVAKFDDHLARNYYITGKSGEVKRIILPRELVKWDK
jgi:hypothetical protein